ncbi:MAG: CvpA family protein [Lachnospiraceae bacterium]|nr:CvpA family protein [Lachnospiraceae bacterium]
MDWICIVIGIAFLICVVIGWARGFLKVLLSVAGLIVSIMLALYVAPRVSGYVQEHTKLDEVIASYISEELGFDDKMKETTKAQEIEVIRELAIPETLKSNMLDNNNSEMYSALQATGVYEYIAKSIAVVIINAVVFLSLLVIARVFFATLGKVADGLTKLPIVRSLDKVGGGVLGMIQGLILIWILFLLLSVTSASSISYEMIASIRQIPLLKLLYDNNLILDIVGDLTRVLFL